MSPELVSWQDFEATFLGHYRSSCLVLPVLWKPGDVLLHVISELWLRASLVRCPLGVKEGWLAGIQLALGLAHATLLASSCHPSAVLAFLLPYAICLAISLHS